MAVRKICVWQKGREPERKPEIRISARLGKVSLDSVRAL